MKSSEKPDWAIIIGFSLSIAIVIAFSVALARSIGPLKHEPFWLVEQNGIRYESQRYPYSRSGQIYVTEKDGSVRVMNSNAGEIKITYDDGRE